MAESDNFMSDAMDILEGIIAGGVLSIGTYIVSSGVSSITGSFLNAGAVIPISVVVGGLAFVGVSIKQMRSRRNK